MSTTSQASNMVDESLSSIEKFKVALEDGCDLHTCDAFGLNVILRAALGDGKKALGKEPFLAVLDFLLERDDFSRIDKITALELAGAVLLSHDDNHAKFALAFQYWRRALSLRLLNTEDSRPLYKTPLKSKNGQLSEWSSLDDIQQIEENLAERELQSLLVRLRILTGISWRAAGLCLFSPSITSITQFLMKGMNGQCPISQVLEVALIVVETILNSERPHQKGLGVALLGVVELLIHTFNSFQNRPPNLSSQDLENFVDSLLMTDPSYGCLPLTKYNNLIDAPVSETRQLIYLLEMCKILFKCRDLITEAIGQSLRTWGQGPSGQNLLLFACECPDYQTTDIVRLLVHLGASPYARDVKGNGVFHILAFSGLGDNCEATARFLLECVHGNGLDMVNEEGMTAADIWFQTNTPGTKNFDDLPSWLKEGESKPSALKSLAPQLSNVTN